MHRKIFLLLLPALTAGCAGVSQPPTPGASREPSVERQVEPDPLPEQRRVPVAPAPERPSAPSAGSKAMPPAIVALLKDAEANRDNGNLDKAAAILERAIRIQPRNAVLWSQMAQVRLQQNQPGIAEDLAKKSNVLARGNRGLVQQNWAIIARARTAKGDSAGALEAGAKAGR